MQPSSAPPAWYGTGTARYLLLLTVGVCAFFAAVWVSGQRNGPLNRLNEAVTLLTYLSAIVLGLRQLRRGWRAAAESLRVFTIVICVALVLASGAALSWLIYNLRGVAVPYPSLVDVFYVTSDIAWAVALCFVYWALDTNVRDELGPFIDTLGVVWSLIIVGLTLLGFSVDAVGGLPKLILDIVYPSVDALICALLGALVFGPQLRRLSMAWRWFIILLYCCWLLTFIADVGFGITTAFSLRHLSVEFLYYDGGPIDAVFEAGNLLAAWAVAFVPVGAALTADSAPADAAMLDLPAEARPR